MSEPLTQQRLKELLHYDPETGAFTWRVRLGNISAGTQAGSPDSTRCGRLRIKISGSFYEASHLAWFYTYGVWPDRLIDHKNNDASYNRLGNLRPATSQQNNSNARTAKTNSLGIKGVRLHQGGKYEARIKVNGIPKNLGKFNTPMEAKAAYDAAARRYFGEFACLG